MHCNWFYQVKGYFGNAFNVKNTKGKIYYFESQVGREYNPSKDSSGVRYDSVRIIKTDNLRISDRAKNSYGR